MVFKSEKVDALAGVAGKEIADEKQISSICLGFYDGKKAVGDNSARVRFFDYDYDEDCDFDLSIGFESEKLFDDRKAEITSVVTNLVNFDNVRSVEGNENNQTKIKVELQDDSTFGLGSHESTAVASGYEDDYLPLSSTKVEVLSASPSCSAGGSRENEGLAEGIHLQQRKVDFMACKMVDNGASGLKGKKNLDYVRRPPNCFILFRKYNKQYVGDEITCQKDVSIKCASVWRTLGADEKAVFKNAANVAFAYHKMKYPDYKYRPRKKHHFQKRIECSENNKIKGSENKKIKGGENKKINRSENMKIKGSGNKKIKGSGNKKIKYGSFNKPGRIVLKKDPAQA